MHSLIINAACVLAGMVLVYAFRGFVGREIVTTAKELKSYVDLLEAALVKDANAARNDIALLLTAIKAKL